jgi:hypothetical protein
MHIKAIHFSESEVQLEVQWHVQLELGVACHVCCTYWVVRFALDSDSEKLEPEVTVRLEARQLRVRLGDLLMSPGPR